MAFDKVVDSAVLNSGLTSIANAIREKGGTSDALTFPAGFAEAIAAIESGGGAKTEFSTLIPASDVIQGSSLTINHGLGTIPDFVLILAKKTPNSGTSGLMYSCLIMYPRWSDADTYHTSYHASAYRASSYQVSVGYITNNSSTLESYLNSNVRQSVDNMTDTTITIVGATYNTGVKLFAGSEYLLIVGAIQDE